MKIAVCDDNLNDRAIIKEWFIANRPEIKQEDIAEFSCGENLLRYLRNATIDIIFLDCQMEGMDGISTVQKVRGSIGDIIVILVSNYAKYAVHGYDVDVFRYILKHEFEAKASAIFEKALSRLEQNEKKAYWIKRWDKTEKINIDEIAYVESSRNKICFRLIDKSSHSQYRKLDYIAKALDGSGFIRCHKSYLVNSRYVRRIMKNTIELDNGDSVPVSRDMHKDAYDTFSMMASEGV